MTPLPPAVAPRSGLWMAGLVLLYGLASVASLLLAARPGQMATLWFANPLGTVALLALPRRQWPLMIVGLGLANLLANVGVQLPTQDLGAQVWQSAAAFVPGNCAEMLLAAWLLTRVGVRAQDLQHPGRLVVLFGVGALVPTLLSALAGAAFVAHPAPGEFARVWATWLAGGLIGSAAVLPLALTVWLRGPRHLVHTLTSPLHLGLLVLAVALTLVAATTLPHPFVVIAMALGLLAAIGGLTVTAAGCLAVAVLIGLLVGSGILLLPPSAAWWGDSLYYGAVLATLLPGIFLAATVDSRRDTLERLSASEARLRSLYTQTPAMLHSLDASGRILQVSQQWLKTLGFAEQDVLGRPITDFLTPEAARLAAALINPNRPDASRITVVELQMVHADGHSLDVVVSAIWEHDGTGQPVRRLAVVEDVTEKKRLAALSHFAEHDALTGLPNRVLLNDRLERLCVHHARYGGQFALAFLDLDHFKAINDTHGHEAGDVLLKTVARRLQDALRASDTVCRLGGDEFVLLLADLDGVAQAQALAQKVLTQVTPPCPLGPEDGAPVVEVGCSMGLAIFPQHGQDPAALLLHADQAMYAAKRSGRNRWVVYLPESRP